MLTHLPDRWDPRQMADLGQRFTGRIKLERLSRLGELLSDSDGHVDYLLEFGHDEHGRARIKGELQATLHLQCQRCLDDYRHHVAHRIALVLVEGLDEAERLSGEYDPLLPEEACISTLALIEDELLLALPLVPMHPRAECSSKVIGNVSEVEPRKGARENPFAVLAELKQKPDSRG